mmetsp:Transcript_5012/g.11118  ORF Transcript_5012/g.11118 Transcript_5012/m.11118 type:complete len:257 (+) Transcript_5012:89-859(+)
MAAADRKATVSALVAKRREAMRRETQERHDKEEVTRERHSKLRITERCMPAEKWDRCMKSKTLLKLEDLGTPLHDAMDQVIIAVLAEKGAVTKNAKGEEYAEWSVTDVDEKLPRRATVVLVGNAMASWASPDGECYRQAGAGAILGFLNPAPTARKGAVRVSFASQVCKLGTCPSLGFCTVRLRSGLPCNNPLNSEFFQSMCPRHAAMSHGEREAENRQPERSGLAVVQAQAAPYRTRNAGIFASMLPAAKRCKFE